MTNSGASISRFFAAAGKLLIQFALIIRVGNDEVVAPEAGFGEQDVQVTAAEYFKTLRLQQVLQRFPYIRVGFNKK